MWPQICVHGAQVPGFTNNKHLPYSCHDMITRHTTCSLSGACLPQAAQQLAQAGLQLHLEAQKSRTQRAAGIVVLKRVRSRGGARGRNGWGLQVDAGCDPGVLQPGAPQIHDTVSFVKNPKYAFTEGFSQQKQTFILPSMHH